jgi:hypothetical protein
MRPCIAGGTDRDAICVVTLRARTIGLLQAILVRHGFPQDRSISILNLVHCSGGTDWRRDWLFARAAFQVDAPAAGSYLELHSETLNLACRGLGRTTEYLLELPERLITRFVEQSVEDTTWCGFRVGRRTVRAWLLNP